MFILIFSNNKWQIYLSASSSNLKVFVCEFYDELLAKNKLTSLNEQLDLIKKFDWQDEK